LVGAPVRSIEVDETPVGGGAPCISKLVLGDGREVEADVYVSAMPVDVFKRLLPPAWAPLPYFAQLRELEGIPVINIHLWFDRKLRSVDGLCFSRSPLLSVYADMSTCCKEYADDEASMLELVFAPCSPAAGSDINWIAKSDEEIVDAAMGELARLFPLDVAPDPESWPATASPEAEAARAGARLAAAAERGGSRSDDASSVPLGEAKLRKHAVVRVPRSVYAALPGKGKFRPSQTTPVPNFVLAGDWTSQKFLGSMEGAVLAGKLAAEVISDRAQGREPKALKSPPAGVQSAAVSAPPTPVGVRGDYPIAFGGGQQGSGVPSHP